MISLFANENELESAGSQALNTSSHKINGESESPSIIRNVSDGYGRSNKFYRRARQIYDRAVVVERLSQQQTA